MEETATVDTTTPVQTTETPNASAALATPAPSSESATSQRHGPMSAKQALAHVAAQDEKAAAVPGAAPIAQTATPTPPSAPTEQGPVPFPVHQTAMDNARAKAVQQRDQQWQKETGWVLELPQEQRAGARNAVRDLYTNPIQFVTRSVTELLNSPQGAAVRAALSPLIGAGNGNGQPAANPLDPDVQVMNEKGQEVARTFSAERVQAIVNKAVEDALGREVRPLREAHDKQIHEAKAAEWSREVNAQADQVVARVDKILEGRKDLAPHVDALMAANPNIDPIDAALQIRERHIVPGQTQQATAAAADVMRRKAAATTANGAGTTTAPLARPTNAKALSLAMQRMDGVA